MPFPRREELSPLRSLGVPPGRCALALDGSNDARGTDGSFSALTWGVLVGPAAEGLGPGMRLPRSSLEGDAQPILPGPLTVPFFVLFSVLGEFVQVPGRFFDVVVEVRIVADQNTRT